MTAKTLLIINPNSSKSVTDNLEQILKPIPEIEFQFFTGPSSAPPEIDGPETSHQSTEACFPILKEKYLGRFDGYLVCCYSDHPLIYKLREVTTKPVLGIFQATMLYSLAYAGSAYKFAILTSTSSWEKILDDAILDFLYGPSGKRLNFSSLPLLGYLQDPLSTAANYILNLFTDSSRSLPSFCLPTVAANVNVLELRDPAKFEGLKKKVQKLVDEGAKIILLGCAGLSGLDVQFKDVFPGIKFVDSVAVGVELLSGLARFDSES
ncbi:unnamed protein product [Kuraishia capsulata CBS 1993]|uniref:Asp/Glu/hydantoin racemase n=1 Tax=Kuraishia capsulata CBS 1993 TaxID=1382522 RepID=W6MSC4_9ASCO|nr:uncharacterized protein KUCA_T00005694001 [Kuraishia capsulata CBS 1993]CDK29701.1 unnamed protein product [Kuraishia capsulata CBS 1993]